MSKQGCGCGCEDNYLYLTIQKQNSKPQHLCYEIVSLCLSVCSPICLSVSLSICLFYLSVCPLSPSQGLCCGAACVLKPSGVSCEEESDCQLERMCSGLSPICPKPVAKANMTVCSLGTRVCLNGVSTVGGPDNDSTFSPIDDIHPLTTFQSQQYPLSQDLLSLVANLSTFTQFFHPFR